MRWVVLVVHFEGEYSMRDVGIVSPVLVSLALTSGGLSYLQKQFRTFSRQDGPELAC